MMIDYFKNRKYINTIEGVYKKYYSHASYEKHGDNKYIKIIASILGEDVVMLKTFSSKDVLDMKYLIARNSDIFKLLKHVCMNDVWFNCTREPDNPMSYGKSRSTFPFNELYISCTIETTWEEGNIYYSVGINDKFDVLDEKVKNLFCNVMIYNYYLILSKRKMEKKFAEDAKKKHLLESLG